MEGIDEANGRKLPNTPIINHLLIQIQIISEELTHKK